VPPARLAPATIPPHIPSARAVPGINTAAMRPSRLQIPGFRAPRRRHSRAWRLLVLLAPLAMACAPMRATPGPAAAAARGDSAALRQRVPARQLIRPGAFDAELLADAVHAATNEQRLRRKLPPLARSAALRRAARAHSREMATRGFFAHENPHDRARRTPWQRMAAEGVAGGHRSENIAHAGVDGRTYLAAADTLVAMWMKSPGHRRNLLSPRMRFLGCGIHAARGPRLQVFATQNFASEAPE
jgi:uncharacterized protein YkwD